MKYYRCNNCGELVKSDSQPGKLDKPCNDGLLHSFQELGEIGKSIYECKNCEIRLNFLSEPKSTNDCHKGDFHNWFKSSGKLQNVHFSTNDSMKNKNVIHRAHLNLLNIIKIGAAGIGIIIFGGIFLKNLLVGGFLLLKDHIVEQFSINPVRCAIIIFVIFLLIVLGIIFKIKMRRNAR